MTIDPTEVTLLRTLTKEHIGLEMTVHGILSVSSLGATLVEPKEDMTYDRIPLAIPVQSDAPLEDSAYVLLTGKLSSGDPLCFPNLRFTIDDMEVYPDEANGTTTSKKEIVKQITGVMTEHGEPIPTRYIIEVLDERGYDTDTTNELISLLLTNGSLYAPKTGFVFGL